MTKCLRLQDAFKDDPVNTCDLKSNMYTMKRMKPKRIDFILYCDEFSSSHRIRLEVRIESVCMCEEGGGGGDRWVMRCGEGKYGSVERGEGCWDSVLSVVSVER